MKYSCLKHGELDISNRVLWGDFFGKEIPKRWCRYCMNELFDRYCGKLIEEKYDDDTRTEQE